jgi:hypothetical protein
MEIWVPSGMGHLNDDELRGLVYLPAFPPSFLPLRVIFVSQIHLTEQKHREHGSIQRPCGCSGCLAYGIGFAYSSSELFSLD